MQIPSSIFAGGVFPQVCAFEVAQAIVVGLPLRFPHADPPRLKTTAAAAAVAAAAAAARDEATAAAAADSAVPDQATAIALQLLPLNATLNRV